ncbi:glycosyltransferase [Flavobacterium reichenbachii]|uniref:Amine oxidase n=1 Tax=Flavobacterium reichenbachii TaxID=362418 RepID=A0A085ZPN9_9FLAO|nr:glycosyltransferase [Flavobacterium reichenbachii]KFF06403.1 amine oxidase [Flavobacterium reichenbachii]OXB14616.1 amine oxidase [Flavobacterium reichenbachii]
MTNNLKETKISSGKTVSKVDEQAQHYDMIVFCHLRWQFVYQRPQHLISRMAETMKVLFIEEPWFDPQNESSGKLIVINENLHVLQPNVTNIESIAAIIPSYVKNKSIAVGWFYSASFCPLLETLEFDTIVYDCMDELSLFKGAPAHLIDQEKYLMANADVIFTGGKSLFESKNQLHSNVHCFPSSVDEKHFGQALSALSVPADIDIQGPIVGYYGVIDERIDLDLLQETAKKLPNVSFVMIGPLAKIEEADLPQESNIYYLGMKSYNELPNYLKAFDIAMMPFALNDATKYISPTKTLEYMAAKKPIISTKIIDVVRDYSICVSLIETADEFAEEISFLLDQSDIQSMNIEYQKILKKTSWDATTEKMKSILKSFAK